MDAKKQRDREYRESHAAERKAYQAEWYAKNKEKRKQQAHDHYFANKDMHNKIAKRSRANLRDEIIKHYGGKCACCGEETQEFLTIDHMEGGGNEHRRELYGHRQGGYKFYTWLRKSGFPNGFQVLCWNCNYSKGIYGECPHRRIDNGSKES